MPERPVPPSEPEKKDIRLTDPLSDPDLAKLDEMAESGDPDFEEPDPHKIMEDAIEFQEEKLKKGDIFTSGVLRQGVEKDIRRRFKKRTGREIDAPGNESPEDQPQR